MDKKKEKEFSTKTQISRNRNEKNLISEMETDEFKRTGERLITIKNNEVISNKNYIESDEISNRQESFVKQQSFISISTNQKDLKRINYNILPCNKKLIKNLENESEREKTSSRNRLNSNFPSNTNRISCEEENIPLGICFICDKISQKFLYYSSGKCLHFFCKKCGKYYYEEKIEDGLFYFTCPVFFCKCEMSIEIIKKLVSEEHFNSIKENQIKINNNSIISDKKNMTKFQLMKNLNENNEDKNNHIKLYSQKHVIDINSNEHFFFYNKSKTNFCPNCKENSLFVKGGNNYIKCLNCFYSMCKFCLKEYDENHLDISSLGHCKVCFRRKDEKISKNSCIVNFFIQLFLVIISYLLLFIGLFFYIFNFLRICFTCNTKKYINNSFLSFIIYFISFLIMIIFSPFLLIFIPYFPILNEIFG